MRLQLHAGALAERALGAPGMLAGDVLERIAPLLMQAGHAMSEWPIWSVDLPTVEATEAFGEAFACAARPALVTVLDGDLGAGKTTWVRAVLRAWGWTGPVRSPTYTLHETYDCATVGRIHHLDLYRLAAPDELAELGLADLWTVPAVWFFEWPSRGRGHLPPIDLTLQWRHQTAGRRVRLGIERHRSSRAGSLDRVSATACCDAKLSPIEIIKLSE